MPILEHIDLKGKIFYWIYLVKNADAGSAVCEEYIFVTIMRYGIFLKPSLICVVSIVSIGNKRKIKKS